MKILLIGFLFSHLTFAKVDPPNYDFSMDKFMLFMPGKSLADVVKEYGQGTIVLRQNSAVTYRFYIEHLRYRFAILVQVQDDKILDFQTRLPHYFLHDIFHQSIINRIGKQDIYKLKDEHAIYRWNDVAGNRHTYEATCTITCFPIYYAVESLEAKKNGIPSVLDQMTNR